MSGHHQFLNVPSDSSVTERGHRSGRSHRSCNYSTEDVSDTSSGSVSVANDIVDEMRVKAEERMYKKCKLPNLEHKQKLFGILKRYRGNCSSAEELVSKFAERCYAGLVKDHHRMASSFAKYAFGSAENLYRQGPDVAWENMLLKQAKILADSAARRKSQQELRKTMHMSFANGKYHVGELLGKGGTAEVRLGYDNTAQKKVALKAYKSSHAKMGANEAEIMAGLDHPNILKAEETFCKARWEGFDKTTVVVLEHAPYGSVIDHILKTGNFEPRLARWVFKQMFKAVEYCHKNNIIHRDIKPDNTIIGEDDLGNLLIKLCDFGGAQDVSQGGPKDRTFGTERYAAPEVLLKKKFSFPVDAFALGVMMFVSLSGSHPFKRACSGDAWYRYVIEGRWQRFWQLHRNYNPAFGADAMDLMEGLMTFDPAKRLTVSEALEHPWLNSRDICTDEEASALLKRRHAKF